MRYRGPYVSGYELYCSLVVLSILWGVSYLYITCELVKAGVLKLSICILYTIIFLQPAVRVIFKMLFRKDIESRKQESGHPGAENEQETIADIFRRMDEIQEEIAHEHRQRKVLEETVNEKISRK